MLEPLLALAFLSGVAEVAVATAAAGRSGGDAECCAAAAAAEEERRDFAASHHVRKVLSHCLSGQRKKSLSGCFASADDLHTIACVRHLSHLGATVA